MLMGRSTLIESFVQKNDLKKAVSFRLCFYTQLSEKTYSFFWRVLEGCFLTFI